MEEGAVSGISLQAGQRSLSVSDLVHQLPHTEEMDPMTYDPTAAESPMEDLWDAETEMSDLQLDANTASNFLEISDDWKSASRSEIQQNRPETTERFQWPQVMSGQSFSSGRHSWQVVSMGSQSWIAGMCYPSIDRKQWQSVIGNNPKSWCLVRSGNQYSVVHDKKELRLPRKVSSDRVGIYLDYGAGEISFYELGDPTRLLHTFTAAFADPLHAALCVWEGCVTTSRRPDIEEVQLTLDVTGDTGLLLDVDTAYNKLFISHDRKTASWSYHLQSRPNTLKRFHCPQVMSCQTFFTGRHYWEVDVGASDIWRVGMCYPSTGRTEWQSVIGNNSKSWCLVRSENRYLAMHDSHEVQLPPEISSHRFRLFLDYEAGQLSFYALNEPIRHLHTFTATFAEPLHAALWLRLGHIRISGGSNPEASKPMTGLWDCTDLSLDVHTASNLVAVSDGGKTVSWVYENQNRPETPNRFLHYPQALSSRSLNSGQHFWKVDVGSSYSWRVGMCYPTIDREGRPGSVIGNNDKSWSLGVDGSLYSVRHAGRVTELPNYISSHRVGVYLDYEAGQLSFYELRDPVRHLHTFTATFAEPLHAIVCVWEGCIRMARGRSDDVSDI
ncbi:LOW QUALITY PROTEIN: uncharacterized protein ACMZJ9_002634 [Mantella aurantiaca]